MMSLGSTRFVHVLLPALAIAVLASTQPIQAQQDWQAVVGAQNADKSHQALAFLPNEIWIHAGDSITWTAKADDIHTVTFLTATQAVPSFTAGCSQAEPYTPSGSSFDGSACVSAPPLARGQTYTVVFPKAGRYKVECLVHNYMTGTIYVLDKGVTLPHDQDFYNDQAAAQARLLFSEGSPQMRMAEDDDSVRVYSHHTNVTAGVGELLSTPGGAQVGSLVRFLHGTVQIHQGDTVEWSNHDPQEPHTITFGTEPANPFPPSPNVTLDADGVRHATIDSISDTVNSGFIEATLPDFTGLVSQNVLDNTRFRITFNAVGTFPYRCVLHDNLGMVGKVVVLP
jgi:plastocyanin